MRSREPDPVGQTRSNIVVGAPVPYDTNNVVYVAVGASNFCSGTLMINSGVLTARNCVEDASGNVLAASSIKVTHDLKISASTTYVQAAEIIRHPSAQVALVRLVRPLTVNGGTRNVNTVLASAPASSFAGKTFPRQRRVKISQIVGSPPARREVDVVANHAVAPRAPRAVHRQGGSAWHRSPGSPDRQRQVAAAPCQAPRKLTPSRH